MMVAFFCVDLKMLALQKHVSQRQTDEQRYKSFRFGRINGIMHSDVCL